MIRSLLSTSPEKTALILFYRFRIALFLLFGLNGFGVILVAQVPPNHTIVDLLNYGKTNYPLIKSRQLELQAAQQVIETAKRKKVPTVDAAYGLNYGTFNNITGMNFPQYLLPISGPPSIDNSYNGVFGSSASLLVNWQPISFGQRQADINLARSGTSKADAVLKKELFDYQIKLIAAYLDLVAADQKQLVLEENIKRGTISLSVGRTLVLSGLKPGLDTAILSAELSKVRIDYLNGINIRERANIQLQQLLATDSIQINPDSLFFKRLPGDISYTDSVVHPSVQLVQASIDYSVSRKKTLEKSVLPVLGIWGTTYARGSGIDFLGNVEASKGLGFQRYNYGFGLQLSIPLLQSIRIKPLVRQEEFLAEAANEQKKEIELQIRKQLELADANWQNALSVAKQTDAYVESVRYSYAALLTRYENGLADLTDLTTAQYNLTKAEIERKTTYINAWKALLYKTAISGNLTLFLNQLK